MIKVDTQRPQRQLRCSYCHTTDPLPVVTCLTCGTWTHPECSAEAKICPTLGCTRPHPAVPEPTDPQGAPNQAGPGLVEGYVSELLMWLMRADLAGLVVLGGLGALSGLVLIVNSLIVLGLPLALVGWLGLRGSVRTEEERSSDAITLCLTLFTAPLLKIAAFALGGA